MEAGLSLPVKKFALVKKFAPMKKFAHGGLVVAFGLAIAVAGNPAGAQAPAPAKSAVPTDRPLRDARYCEIIPVVREGVRLVATVYNTLGLNDCPAAMWDALSQEALKKRFGAVEVRLNGPRHFLMDSIIAEGATAAGETIEVGGIALTKRATIHLSLSDLHSQPYSETTIERETRYLFQAGKPIFVLEAPEGRRYVMQAYAQIVDKGLSYDDLPKLGSRLKLPKGWRYTTPVPDKDLVAGAQGKAIVIQDELGNTYQRLP